MKSKLVLELNDVYGGDGYVRSEKIKKPSYTKTKRKTEKRSDIDLKVIDRETEEETSSETSNNVHTFKFINGAPTLRIGGSHGKLYGVFKEASKYLKLSGEKPFTSGYMSIVNTTFITPIEVMLENVDISKIEIREIPQVLSGIGHKMIIERYDVINKCNITVELNYPDTMKNAIEQIVENIHLLSILNKRRTTCKVIEFKEI